VLDPPTLAELKGVGDVDTSAVVRERVRIARDRAAFRLDGTPYASNSEIPGPVLRSTFPLGDAAAPLDAALRLGTLTARGADRVARMAWTSADLAGRDRPTIDDVAGAVIFRDAAGRWAA
jgi:magnesium chelatase family protein